MLIASLLGLPTKAIAEPLDIALIPNIKVYAFEQVLNRWGDDQWVAFNEIIKKESLNWKVTTAHYPSGYTSSGVKSSAHGLGGFLDGTWQTVGCKKTDDPYKQISCTVEYIDKNYGTPKKAFAFHIKNNYY